MGSKYFIVLFLKFAQQNFLLLNYEVYRKIVFFNECVPVEMDEHSTKFATSLMAV